VAETIWEFIQVAQKRAAFLGDYFFTTFWSDGSDKGVSVLVVGPVFYNDVQLS
jgi:hypothetical protein